MHFDPDNKIVQLCAKGMELEGAGKADEASGLFLQAWSQSTSDFEKFTSAHYVARHQKTTAEKLHWDETALQFALNINDETIKATYPSLYLNIAKCYEDINDKINARKNYMLASSFIHALSNDGYGNMIRAGIANGLERVKE